jgi:hypothetical protein
MRQSLSYSRPPSVSNHLTTDNGLAGDQGHGLGDSQGGLSQPTIGQKRTHELAAEGVTEQLAARSDRSLIVACVPLAQAGRRAVRFGLNFTIRLGVSKHVEVLRLGPIGGEGRVLVGRHAAFLKS